MEIVFDRVGRRYVVRNNAHQNPKDNLRAAQLTITLLYQAIETYGTQRSDCKLPGGEQATRPDPFASFLLGFEATPSCMGFPGS